MSHNVLVIEDDPGIARIVRLYLEQDGHRVATAGDGVAGLKLARESAPDLIVLDLMLPRLDGMEICRALRQDSDVPIIMVTARVAEEDRLAGLDLGADDYVLKPFSPRELAARVRAVLRRTARQSVSDGPASIEYCGMTIDLKTRAVLVGERKPSLTPTEFRLLTMLAAEPGRTFTRDQIIEGVFGYDFDGFDRTVDVHVANLRRKIEPDGKKHRYVQTVHGVGYRFGDAPTHTVIPIPTHTVIPTPTTPSFRYPPTPSFRRKPESITELAECRQTPDSSGASDCNGA